MRFDALYNNTTAGENTATGGATLFSNTTVGLDCNSYDGTYDNKYYAADGTLACEDTGTTHATRVSVNQSNTTANK